MKRKQKIKEKIKEYNTLMSKFDKYIRSVNAVVQNSYYIHPSLTDFADPKFIIDELPLEEKIRAEQLLYEIRKESEEDLITNNIYIYSIRMYIEKLKKAIIEFYEKYYKDNNNKLSTVQLELTECMSITSFESFKEALTDHKIKKIYLRALKLEKKYLIKRAKEIKKLSLLGIEEINRLIEEHTVNTPKIISNGEIKEEVIVFDDMLLGNKLLEAKKICEKEKTDENKKNIKF